MNQEKSSVLQVKESREKIVSTILIPEKYWALFESYKIALCKDTEGVLEYLLENFQNGRNAELASRGKFTTRYQDEGLNLQKHNFWVCSSIWQRLKSLARFYGLSMCRLFTVLLLALEFLGTPRNKVTPSWVKLYEKVRIPWNRTVRRYSVQVIPSDTS